MPSSAVHDVMYLENRLVEQQHTDERKSVTLCPSHKGEQETVAKGNKSNISKPAALAKVPLEIAYS